METNKEPEKDFVKLAETFAKSYLSDKRAFITFSSHSISVVNIMVDAYIKLVKNKELIAIDDLPRERQQELKNWAINWDKRPDSQPLGRLMRLIYVLEYLVKKEK